MPGGKATALFVDETVALAGEFLTRATSRGSSIAELRFKAWSATSPTTTRSQFHLLDRITRAHDNSISRVDDMLTSSA